MKDIEKTIGNLIDKQRTVLIGSVDIEGFPNIKVVLQPRKREGIRILYFTTNTSSMRTTQYLKNHHTCVYFYDSRFFKGVMLKGKTEVLTDNSTREMVWREGDTLYYPLGVIGPGYCVLEFTTITGGRYGNFSSEDFEVGQAVFNLKS